MHEKIQMTPFIAADMFQYNKRRRLRRFLSNSTPQELLFDSLRERADKVLRGCFSFFKTDVITTKDIMDIAVRSSCISEAEYGFVINSSENDLQIDRVIKFIIRKGEEYCFNFIKHLYYSNFTTIVNFLQTHTDEFEIDIGEDSILTTKLLHEETAYLRSNIKVNKVLDMLFEKRVLSIDEHDYIQMHESRSEKRKALLSIILKKSNSTWLPPFIKCLQLTGHEGMLRELRCRQNGQPTGTKPWNDLPTQYVACITNVNNPPSGSTTVPDMSHDAMSVFAQCVDAGLIDVWEGSLYMLLFTTYPAKLNDIIVSPKSSKIF